ncbi:MAG: VWA domain-containing protein [Ferruginibacter sp.]|nr:VWA domain-containing protein [Ferruginibacter sp.]
MPSFQNISYLYTLLAIPIFIALYFYILQWKKNTKKKIGDERLVNELTKHHSNKKFAIKFALVTGAFALCVLALANLRSVNGRETVSKNGIDIMIALDVSKSMLAQDVEPNRLTRAKQLVSKLVDALGNNRIGIVLFAGKAYLQMPLTADYAAAKMLINTASTDAVPTQGTVISDALKMCYSSFNTKEKKYKLVVVITDGENHDEEAISITKKMALEGVMVSTIGIGSPEGSTIIDEITNETKKDAAGNTVITKLNENVLKEIAQAGNGIYQLFSSTNQTVTALQFQLNNMDKRLVTEESNTSYTSYYQWFLALALLLLFIELFISEVKNAKKEKLKTANLSYILFFISYLVFPQTTVAQSQQKLLKQGSIAYKNQDYEKAAATYKKVVEKSPSNTTAQYNLGNAMYKKSKVDEAVQAFDNTIKTATDKNLKSKAYYNKGVVLQKIQNLPGCIEAYKEALKINPNDDDARQNLQKALQQLKEQQKKQKEDKKKKPKEDENKKEKEKPKDEDQKNNQPKPQPSKISKQDAEEKLISLQQKEKELQDKLKKVGAASPQKPEKDW